MMRTVHILTCARYSLSIDGDDVVPPLWFRYLRKLSISRVMAVQLRSQGQQVRDVMTKSASRSSADEGRKEAVTEDSFPAACDKKKRFTQSINETVPLHSWHAITVVTVTPEASALEVRL